MLRKNRRGHDVAATRRALRLLRGAGFKLHVHWMPNLYGSRAPPPISTTSTDSSRIRTSVPTRSRSIPAVSCRATELERHYRSGAWRPYTHQELLDVLSRCLRRIPEYCRLTRLVRDIPSQLHPGRQQAHQFSRGRDHSPRRAGVPKPRHSPTRDPGPFRATPNSLRLTSICLRYFAGARALPSVRDAGVIASRRSCASRSQRAVAAR